MQIIGMQEPCFTHLRPTAHPPVRRISFLHGPPSIVYDLRAEVETTFRPGEAGSVTIGLIITGPPGARYRIAPRSGLVQARGLVFGGGHPLPAPGGLEVLLSNVRAEPATLPAGEHIADLIYEPPRPRPPPSSRLGDRVWWKSIDIDRPDGESREPGGS